MIRTALVGISAVFAAGLLFVNFYNSVVDAANWNSSIPESIAVTRQYFSVASPGSFFRIASPLNQLLTVIAVIACWKYGRIRYVALGALALAISADLLTFGYFYPRLEVMFSAPLESNTENIRQATAQWASMNWFRSGLCTVNTFLAMTVVVVTAKKSVI